jgi:HPt (histidine-containing phosphotransfer) domain-containing protein
MRVNLNQGSPVMTRMTVTARKAICDDVPRNVTSGDVPHNVVPRVSPAFDARSFDTLREMIGEDGAREMVEIFETETRRRLQRLVAGGHNTAALVREMHTLKGAAGTVASPRLAELGRTLEQSAERGITPTPRHLNEIESALEAFLAAARARNESPFPA